MDLTIRSATTTSVLKPSRAWTEDELSALSHRFPEGMSVQQIVDAFIERGERLSEATFRKYVQLGLLPRSVRVGRKGKHRGSQGLYPITAIRRIDRVRELMSQGFTIDEIQKEFLFVRGEVEELNRQLQRVRSAFERTIGHPQSGASSDPLIEQLHNEVRDLSEKLLSKLEQLEGRLSTRARMARAAI